MKWCIEFKIIISFDGGEGLCIMANVDGCSLGGNLFGCSAAATIDAGCSSALWVELSVQLLRDRKQSYNVPTSQWAADQQCNQSKPLMSISGVDLAEVIEVTACS